MRTNLIGVVAPCLDGLARVAQADEYVLVGAFISQPLLKLSDESMLYRFSRIQTRPTGEVGSRQQLGLERLKREVNAASHFQILREPRSRKVGSCERRSASLTSSYPAKRL